MATLNYAYVTIQPIVERGSSFEVRLRKAIEELRRSEEQRLKLAEEAKVTSKAKTTLEKENTKLKEEKAEL